MNKSMNLIDTRSCNETTATDAKKCYRYRQYGAESLSTVHLTDDLPAASFFFMNEPHSQADKQKSEQKIAVAAILGEVQTIRSTSSE